MMKMAAALASRPETTKRRKIEQQMKLRLV
jgi:hypothetical protein